MRHNPAKLLVDPYARGFAGRLRVRARRSWAPSRRSARRLVARRPATAPRTTADSLAYVPHSVVVGHAAACPRPLTRPRVPWADTVVYEAHVRGLTMLREDIPDGAARHVRGGGAPGRRRAPAEPGRDHAGAAARSTRAWPSRGSPRTGLHQLLGLQHARVLRAERRLRDAGRRRSRAPEAVLDEVRGMVARCCTRRASRCCSTSSTTTPARAATTACTWPGAASTTRSTTCTTAPRPPRSRTSRARATRWTSGGREVIRMTLDSLRYWAETSSAWTGSGSTSR